MEVVPNNKLIVFECIFNFLYLVSAYAVSGDHNGNKIIFSFSEVSF